MNGGDITGHANRGQPVRFRADTHNALMELLRHWRTGGQRAGADASPLGNEPTVQVEVQNDCGSDVDEFAILAVASPVITLADSPRDFKDGRMLSGTTPSATANIVITQEPIPAGKFGRATILGLTPCQVNVTDAAHNYAEPSTSTSMLTSSTSGPAIIIARESGTGTVWALVLLTGQAGADTTGGGVGGGGTGGAFSGASVYLPDTSGLYMPNRFLRRRWDTDGYHRTTAGRDASRLYPPEPGWYMLGVRAASWMPLGTIINAALVATNKWAPEQVVSNGYIIAQQAGTQITISAPWYFHPGWWGEVYITGSTGGGSLIPPSEPHPMGAPGYAVGAEFWIYKLGAGSLGPLPLGDAPLGDVPMGGQESPTPADTPSDPAPTPTPSFPSPLDPYQSPPWSPRVEAMGGEKLGDEIMGGGEARVIFPNEGAAFLDYTGTPAGGLGGGDFTVNTVFVPPPTWEDYISIANVVPGTYRVTAILTATAEISSTAPAWIHMRIYNSTGSAALGSPARIVTCHTANAEYTDCATLHFDFTITATSTIKLQVKIDDAGHNPTFTTALILNSGDDVPTYFLRRIFDDE